jgi:hypothetical protein
VHHMKAFSKFGLLLAVGLMACAALAASAQAQTVNPDNTAIVGTATNPTLDYEGTIVRCNTGTASGTTGTDSAIVDVGLTFSGNCNIAGLAATVTCNGQARLRALTADTNLGEADELLSGFSCVVTVSGVCTVTVAAQQLPISGGVNSANLLNEGGATAIDANVDVNASRTGSTLCGPATGVGGFTGVYDLNPDVSFD